MTETVELGDVVRVDRTIASEADCERLPYVGLEHIEKDVGAFSPSFAGRPETVQSTKFRFGPHHVLYGKLRPYLNKVALPEFSGVCTTEILPLCPKDSRIDKLFLYAVLLSPEFVGWATSNVSGANLPRLGPERLIEYKFPLPPVGQQRKIGKDVAIANHLRQSRRYAQTLSDTFLQSVFLQMFGDPAVNAADYRIVPFEEVVDSAKIGLVRAAGEMSDTSPYAYVRMDAITGDGNLNLQGLRRVEASSKEATEYALSPGDFLFNTRNSWELVGKTGLFTEAGTYLFNNNILRVRFNSVAEPRYMAGLFQTSWAKKNLNEVKSGTTNVFAIYYKDLREIPVVLPPLPLQQEYAGIVRRFERMRAQQQEATRQAEHLFQSLLARAFAGAL